MKRSKFKSKRLRQRKTQHNETQNREMRINYTNPNRTYPEIIRDLRKNPNLKSRERERANEEP